jgi:hypothetical protein
MMSKQIILKEEVVAYFSVLTISALMQRLTQISGLSVNRRKLKQDTNRIHLVESQLI